MTKFYKWLLFISSYAPLYLLLAISTYDFKLTPFQYYKSILNSGTNLYFWFVIVTLFIVSFVAIGYFKFISLNERRSLTGLKPINESILSYLITYVIPLTAMDVSSINSLVVNGFLFLIIGIVYVNSDLLYLNILLILFGYRVYNDSSNNIIITNYSKNELTIYMNTGESILCRKVVKGVYLVRSQKQT
ncbi:hypothetical protein [Schinkia azotoformans]|uniref:hypothetical protein n=1 Tax=Schinkia azotoformans TaxID=1454 RepID=UPI002DBDD1D2|nr:hypothetical protein [Schinkia azotoformans]MEC1716988.1 hypothetical protein [Schinkia azotoformans]MEC1743271.1 hypothetical protein [Schinkia azotoformans]MEC1744848.1 hypothetical protein [Schinkia azotoformans]MEC1757028.1 hypothetical protein [Schinkia azotoformans]MEC1767017.1 hypothetical protein [Schinkia azotoformans]